MCACGFAFIFLCLLFYQHFRTARAYIIRECLSFGQRAPHVCNKFHVYMCMVYTQAYCGGPWFRLSRKQGERERCFSRSSTRIFSTCMRVLCKVRCYKSSESLRVCNCTFFASRRAKYCQPHASARRIFANYDIPDVSLSVYVANFHFKKVLARGTYILARGLFKGLKF